MRVRFLLALTPLALAACGGHDRPVVVNAPPQNPVVVPAPSAPSNTVVVPSTPAPPSNTTVVPVR